MGSVPDMSTSTTMASEWQKFFEKVVPKGASPRQVSDMRSAFYAGAFVVMECFDVIVLDPGVDVAVGGEFLAGLRREIEAYCASVISGANSRAGRSPA